MLLDDGVPHPEVCQWLSLGPLNLGVGRFQEISCFHKPSGALLVTDALVGISAQPPALFDLDPTPLLFHARERGDEPLRDSVEARAACLGTGADDFWLSVIGPSDLLLRLRLHRTIQQRSGQRPALLQLDDLSVDPTSRTVRRGGRVVALTAREFMLLQVLLRRRGQVLSRDALLREVWQGERSSSNVVEVYVRYLRQKLEAGGERRLLHTVRGQGYCLGQVLPEA